MAAIVLSLLSIEMLTQLHAQTLQKPFWGRGLDTATGVIDAASFLLGWMFLKCQTFNAYLAWKSLSFWMGLGWIWDKSWRGKLTIILSLGFLLFDKVTFLPRRFLLWTILSSPQSVLRSSFSSSFSCFVLGSWHWSGPFLPNVCFKGLSILS